MNFRNAAAVCLIMVIFSCSKDKSVEKDNSHSSDSTSYQPVSAGSTWHYHDDLNQNGGFTLTATGKDTLINGTKFYIFSNKPDTSSQIIETCFGQEDNNYYAVGLLSSLGDNVMLYLKDTSKLNATWTQNVSLNIPQLGNVNAELDFTLAEVNATETVNNKTYKQVAHVALEILAIFPAPLGKQPTGITGDMYFARGIGVISVQLQNNQSAVSGLSLDSYTIQ